MKYLLFALAAMLIWGLWGFLPKLATGSIDCRSATFWTWTGMLIVAMTCLALVGGKPQTGGHSFLWAMATGFCGLLGALFYYKAMSMAGGNTATVIVLSALYPVVSVLLAALILRERLNAGQLVGILLCTVGAVVLVCFSPKSQVTTPSGATHSAPTASPMNEDAKSTPQHVAGGAI